MNKRQKVWPLPLLLGVVSVIGLVLALVADGWADAVSVLLLALPATVALWLGYLRRASR